MWFKHNSEEYLSNDGRANTRCFSPCLRWLVQIVLGRSARERRESFSISRLVSFQVQAVFVVEVVCRDGAILHINEAAITVDRTVQKLACAIALSLLGAV